LPILPKVSPPIARFACAFYIRTFAKPAKSFAGTENFVAFGKLPIIHSPETAFRFPDLPFVCHLLATYLPHLQNRMP
jgi:hypothetical protein